MRRCLYCYKELQDGQVDFHSACCRKMFGQNAQPEMPYTHDEIGHLARQVVSKSITIPGVQAKLSLDIQQQAKQNARFTIVGLWGKYILKPQTDQYPYLPELEDLTMHMAEAAKIITVPHSLVRFADGKLCYLTRRIDRTVDGSKLPMEDMCQLTERLTEYKYKGSYEQIAKAIRQYSSAPLMDLTIFWEQVLFAWLTGNSDMHLKNFSLYQPMAGRIQLTPAYDMLAVQLVMPEDTEELALTLNGKKRKLTAHDFCHAMSQTGLTDKAIDNMFARLIACHDVWKELINTSFLPQEMQEAYIQLIENRIKQYR